MCEHGTLKMVRLCKPRQSGRIAVPVDYCIADEVQKMNDSGVVTVSSCCGHGNGKPHALVDEISLKLLQSLGYETQPYVYADGETYGVYEVNLRGR